MRSRFWQRPEVVAQLAKHAEDGLSAAKAAQLLGVSRSSVIAAGSRRGIHFASTRPPRPSEPKPDLWVVRPDVVVREVHGRPISMPRLKCLEGAG